jgi:DNA polymerase III alpha subunit
MDFLGLHNLTIIEVARFIKRESKSRNRFTTVDLSIQKPINSWGR